MITLGQKVKDKVTGFIGIATARADYLNGCVQFCIKPQILEGGKMIAGEWIDDQQLEIVGDGILIQTESDGGPMSDMPSENYKG